MALIKVSELSSTGSVKIDDLLLLSTPSGSGYTSNHISINDLVSSQPFLDLNNQMKQHLFYFNTSKKSIGNK